MIYSSSRSWSIRSICPTCDMVETPDCWRVKCLKLHLTLIWTCEMLEMKIHSRLLRFHTKWHNGFAPPQAQHSLDSWAGVTARGIKSTSRYIYIQIFYTLPFTWCLVSYNNGLNAPFERRNKNIRMSTDTYTSSDILLASAPIAQLTKLSIQVASKWATSWFKLIVLHECRMQ